MSPDTGEAREAACHAVARAKEQFSGQFSGQAARNRQPSTEMSLVMS
jgi:hypothetical protein